MTPLKRANKERELDALAFSVLVSFHQQGATPWTHWFETTRARRGKRGLGPGTFSQIMKRLIAKGRVQVDSDGYYQVVDGAVENAVVEPDVQNPKHNVQDADRGLTAAGTSATVEPKHFSEAPEASLVELREAEAEIEKLRAENKRLIDWIMGENDALGCLQAIYQSPESSEHTKIKAAASALPFERPKLSVAVSVRGSAVLAERLAAARAAKMKTINPPNPPTIDHETSGG